MLIEDSHEHNGLYISSKTSLNTKKDQMNSDSDLLTLDWDEKFNNLSFDNFYVNWNPAMNKYRRRLHFSLSPENFFEEHFIDSSIFNNYQKTQLMISLSPHNEKNECKFIFERHRQEKSFVNYEIRIRLYGYNRTRMRASTDCYKEIRIREDQVFDVIPDTMIFEECEDFDNYIMLIEVIPQAFLQNLDPAYDYKNQKDPLMSKDSIEYFNKGKLKVKEDLLMSLSLYCWFETEIVPIPFRELAQIKTFILPDIKTRILKLEILEETEIELRVEGFEGFKYGIGITQILKNFGNKENTTPLDSETYLSRNRTPREIANILTVQLEEGHYFIHIFETEIKNKEKDKNEFNMIKDKYLKKSKKHYKIQLFAFNSTFQDNYNSSIERIEKAPEEILNLSGVLIKSKHIEQSYFKADIIQKFGLSYSQNIKGYWSPEINRNINKYEFDSLQSFHRNPGYVITLDKDSQISFFIEPSALNDPKCLYKFCLYEIQDNYEPKPILEMNNFINNEFNSDIFYLVRNKNGYLVLLVPRYKSFSSDFKMTIKSDHKIYNIRSNLSGFCQLPWTKEYKGTVKSYQGGTLLAHSFFMNKCFVFLINQQEDSKTEDLFIEIESENKDNSLGFYVIPIKSPEQLFKMQPNQLANAKLNKVFLPEFNSLYMKVKPGYHMVIPTTHQPFKDDQFLDYSLKIFCSGQFTLSRNQEFGLKQILSRKIRNQKDKKFKIQIKNNKVGVMIVVKGADGYLDLQVIDMIIGKS
jgi:hypothetical protein